MDTKTELVALAIRALSTKTTLIHKPSSFETLLAEISGAKTYDQQLAEDVIAEVERVAKIVSRVSTNWKFKKIIKNG